MQNVTNKYVKEYLYRRVTENDRRNIAFYTRNKDKKIP